MENKYRVAERDGRAVIIDGEGRSIVSIHTSESSSFGAAEHYSTPVFEPDMARRIVKALALADAIDALASLEPTQ